VAFRPERGSLQAPDPVPSYLLGLERFVLFGCWSSRDPLGKCYIFQLAKDTLSADPHSSGRYNNSKTSFHALISLLIAFKALQQL
jgi:hypothetical protein